jgi:FkbM family methyltransferase
MLVAMQSISFDFCGRHVELLLPDGDRYRTAAEDVLRGLAYPIPANDEGPPLRTIVDLGAHAGEFTIMAAARWPSATVHAFEPNPLILPNLHHNCKPFTNVVIHEQAIDAQPRRGKLYWTAWGSLVGTVISPSDPALAAQLNSAEVDILGPDAVTALAPDILKIDIEGPEGMILQSMGEAVSRIRRIYIEFHDESIRKYLEQILQPTHSLAYARIPEARQGEVMYLKRDL